MHGLARMAVSSWWFTAILTENQRLDNYKRTFDNADLKNIFHMKANLIWGWKEERSGVRKNLGPCNIWALASFIAAFSTNHYAMPHVLIEGGPIFFTLPPMNFIQIVLLEHKWKVYNKKIIQVGVHSLPHN